MSNQRYSPEFKDEAVRQVIERGHHVVDVAKNLGISQHSLYKQVKACKPDSSAQKENELLDAKKEILRLRSQLKRTEEERYSKKGRKVLCKSCTTTDFRITTKQFGTIWLSVPWFFRKSEC